MVALNLLYLNRWVYIDVVSRLSFSMRADHPFLPKTHIGGREDTMGRHLAGLSEHKIGIETSHFQHFPSLLLVLQMEKVSASCLPQMRFQGFFGACKVATKTTKKMHDSNTRTESHFCGLCCSSLLTLGGGKAGQKSSDSFSTPTQPLPRGLFFPLRGSGMESSDRAWYLVSVA